LLIYFFTALLEDFISKKLFISVLLLAAVVATVILVMCRQHGSTENVAFQPAKAVTPSASEILKDETHLAAQVQPNAILKEVSGAQKPGPALVRFKQGAQLAALYNELIGSQDIGSLYLASEIVQQCALFGHMNESTYKAVRPGTLDIAVQTLKAVKQSCAGLDVSNAAVARAYEMGKKAKAAGDPAATAVNVIMMSKDTPADAYDVARTLLKRYPDNPIILEAALTYLSPMLSPVGSRIGSDDEVLRGANGSQADVALMLALCQKTNSCDLQSSSYLQRECVVGGRCAPTMQDYASQFLLPQDSLGALPTYTARLSELIAQQRWDLLGYTDANRPSQTKPSIITAPTLPPSTYKPKTS
jgi:hypothetical protein